MTAPAADEGLVRVIGVRALALACINLIVGASIFVLPASMAGDLGPAAIIAYGVCALILLLVGLCFAEAGSRVSASGGTYAYIERAFGPYVGFLANVFLAFGSGVLASASVSNAFVGTLGAAVPALGQGLPRGVILTLLYGGLVLVQVRGVRGGVRFVEGVTAAKLVPLLLLLALGFFHINPQNLVWTGTPTLDEIGRAVLLLFFAFQGIENALTSSGEIVQPSRTVPRAILVAITAITLLYGGIQLTAQGILGPELPAHERAPLADAAGVAIGGWARALLLVGAAVSMFGWVGGDLLAQPRALFALARDGMLPAPLARVHPVFRTPHVAIIVYAALALGFAVTGSFRTLALVASGGALMLYLLACLAAIRLRRLDVRAEGAPLDLPGGTVVAVLASIAIVWVLSSLSRAEFAALALMVVAATAMYAWARWRGSVRRVEPTALSD
ncbi:MAG TPA: APC family permease [Gemmatimonadales bacterium]|nr:APC family permease [Gemmatimonadales bacterium]